MSWNIQVEAAGIEPAQHFLRLAAGVGVAFDRVPADRGARSSADGGSTVV
jgi:hypothetical protein